MTTIDMLRNPSIRAVLTAAARIAPTATATRPAFTLRNLPAGISLTRAADLMEATAAAACERKQRAGRKGWHLRAKWHTLIFTFYWEPHPPADEPAVIAEAVDVLRAAELQAAIVRGADDDGPCTIPDVQHHPPRHRARPPLPRQLYRPLALALPARRGAVSRPRWISSVPSAHSPYARNPTGHRGIEYLRTAAPRPAFTKGGAPMPTDIADAAARSAKARKTLDTMRARIVKADEARTDAAHHSRAAQVAEAATAAEAWDTLATQAAQQADQCRHGAALADRTRHRWAR